MIHLMIGSTGAGKSTQCIRIEKECNAFRLAVDDWMNILFRCDTPKENAWNWSIERVERCERQIWKLAQNLLNRGIEVVLDINMMTREIRDRQRAFAKNTGFPLRIYCIDTPTAVRRERVKTRNNKKGETFNINVSARLFDYIEGIFEPPTEEELKDATIIKNYL